LEELEIRVLPSFSMFGTLVVGTSPSDMAVGSFQASSAHSIDLAVANSGSNTVTVLLGNGDGTFKSPTNYAVGSQPTAVALGTFNNDIYPDLAVANGGSNTVSVLLNSGSGTFNPAQNYPVGGLQPSSVMVGDFNGDGKADLAVANYTSTNVSILLGNGNGTFQAAQTFAVGFDSASVAVDDSNGDGKPDLVVANSLSNTVSVLINTSTFGALSFAAAQNFAVGSGPKSVAMADFNRDGIPDILTANSGSNTVSVLMGNGNGTFQPAQNFNVGVGPDSVAASDVNGDFFPDLVVTNATSNTVSVLLGNGNGSFDPSVNFAVGTGPTSVAEVNINYNNGPDLVVTNGTSGTVSVLVNDDAPYFAFQPAQTIPVARGPSVATADLNGDGLLDLAVGGGSPYTVSVMLGNGDGSFQAAQNSALGQAPTSVKVADFNEDGHPDLAMPVAGNNVVSTLLGNGNGTFQARQNLSPTGGVQSLAIGDVNGDGHADLVAGGQNSVQVLLGNGNGTFQTSQSFAAGIQERAVALGDFNGDGRLDIVTANDFNNTVSVLLGNGNGTFQAALNITVGTYPRSLAVADLNGDGHPDIVVGNYGSDTVSVLLSNGNGSFKPPKNSSVGVDPASVAVADMNGDGIPDLIVANEFSTTVSVLLGNGNGTFQAARNFPVGTNEDISVAPGDFNRDGAMDLAVAWGTYGSVSVLLNVRRTTTHFVVKVPTSATSGTPFPITVEARNAANLVDALFTGTVSISSSDSQAILPANYAFSPADDGRHTFMVTFNTSGPQTLTASSGGFTGTSAGVPVAPAAPTHLVFVQQPIGSLVGATLTPAVTVKLLDASNNLASSSATVNLMANGPGGFTGGSETSVAAVNGVATFSNLAFTAAGSFTISAASTGLTGANSNTFTVSPVTTRTWSGNGPDNSWSDAANWLENIPPAAGDDLFFPDGAARMATSTNDLTAGTVVNSINFTGTAGGYDLLGNTITLNRGIGGNMGVDRIDLAAITLGSNVTFDASSSTLTVASAINLNNFTLTLSGLAASTGKDSLSGNVSGTGSLANGNTSVWIVSGNNTYVGPITVSSGTQSISSSSGLGAATNTVTVASGASLQISNDITVLQPLTISGTGNSASGGAINIQDTAGNDTLGAVTMAADSTILSANLGVNTLTLSGLVQNNGFNFSIVGGGGFATVLTGSIIGSGYLFNYGSIFSGTGTVVGPVVISQGSLRPGVGGNPGVLTTGDLIFSLGTTFQPVIAGSTAGSGYSQVISNGSITLSGTSLLPIIPAGFVQDPAATYVIMQAQGSINGTFNGLPDGSLLAINGHQFLIRYLNGSSSVLNPSIIFSRVVLFPVPAVSKISLVISPNPVIAGQAETLTAIVSSPASPAVAGIHQAVITGTVTFSDMGKVLGTSPVTGGSAVFFTTSLTAGNHSITAAYGGSQLFLGSNTTATPLSLAVNNGSVGWQHVLTGNFATFLDPRTNQNVVKGTSIAGMTANGQWWVAVSSGSNFSNQLWGSWPVATWVDVQTGDFNNDGLTDIAGRNLQTGQWYVAISTGSSFTTSVWTGWNPGATWADVKVADFTGDGKSDIAGRILGFGQWWIATSTGSSFINSLWTSWNENANVTWVDVKVGDFNGDGKADLTARWSQGGSWWTALSTGSSFTTSLWASWSPAATWVDVSVGDFNGDGKADITARYLQAGQWWTAISTGSSFVTSLWATWNPKATWVDVKVGDFNGDGKADVAARWLDGGQWWLGQSTSSAFVTTMWDTWSPAATWVDVNVADVTGDGLPDLVGRIQQGGQWWAAISNGSSAFINQLWTTWAV
jgi:hypothetical protein